MKLKERKGNKSEKEVKPVKKSVALVLTIVTVFAFAAACFSLGFCSGKKVNEAYASISGQFYFYMSDTIKEPSQDYAATFASCGVDYTSMWENSDGYLCYTNTSSTVQVYNYNTNKWVNEKYRYLYVHGTNSDEFLQFFVSQSIMPSDASSLYAGTYVWNDTITSYGVADVSIDFISNRDSSYDKMKFTTSNLRYHSTVTDTTDTIYTFSSNSWNNINGKSIQIGADVVLSSKFYTYFLSNIASFSTSSGPVEYTATVDFPVEVNFKLQYTAGVDVSYNDTSGVFTGPEGGTFTIKMVPNSGYRISTFSVVDTVDIPTGTVSKTSTNLYTMTFGAGNMELVITASASLETYNATLNINTTGLYSFGFIEGPGTVYDENAETVTGAPGTYFRVQLMPFEGYMVDTFTVTASDGTAKSIVKNSDTLYTITFDSEDFVLNISATVKEIEYTLTCEYEGAQNYSITYGMTGEITRNGNVFTGQPGASAYVRITPNDGYIMRSLSYQITDGEVLSVSPGSSNNYTIVLTSSNATILFSVVATAAKVDISSGYYWIQCRNYGTDFSELALQSGQFQIVESVSSSGIVWQDLTGLVCEAGKLSFRLPGDKRISFYTVTETHDDFSLSSGVVISNQGNIVEGYDYDYYSTLWAANWYPVIYVPSNIMEDEVSDALVSFFKSSSVYKADPVYYSGFYLTKNDTIANSNAFYNTYLGVYVPAANTLVSPSSISFVPVSGGVSNIAYKSALNFMGDVSSGEYVIYCGYNYKYNSTVSYSRVGRIPPAPKSGTYMESIYIYPTIMPEKLYNLMASWFDITSGAVVPDPPPSSYWDGLEEVLSYEIFGIPLSSLLAIVVSSVFVVVVIRLFAGG